MSLRAAYANLRRRSNQAFSAFGMTSDQYVLLSVLAQSGQATQQELVRRCSSDTATIGTMVALLETKGLLTRVPHPRDGRARSVQLTRAGRALATKMRRSTSRLRVEWVSLFQAEELRQLVQLLDRLSGALQPPSRRTSPAVPRRTPAASPRQKCSPSA